MEHYIDSISLGLNICHVAEPIWSLPSRPRESDTGSVGVGSVLHRNVTMFIVLNLGKGPKGGCGFGTVQLRPSRDHASSPS